MWICPNRSSMPFQISFARMLKLNLITSKKTLLSNRLRRRIKSLNIESYTKYLEFLVENSAEQEEFFHLVTTNETYFFRNYKHWQTLSNQILPRLLKENPRKKIQIWCAGCSSGEEAYTMAMVLLDSMVKQGLFEFNIIATDLSYAMIGLAEAGLYSDRSIAKVPDSFKKRFFSKAGNEWQVRQDLKKYITFKKGNLFTDAPPVNPNLIFCRNVMIYFTREDQKTLVERFYQALSTPGYLLVGHAESLHLLENSFTWENLGETTVYIKKAT